MCQGTSQDSLDCQVTVCHCETCLANKMGHRTYPKVQALHQSSSSPSPWALWTLCSPSGSGYSKARAWRDYFQESPLSLIFLWFFSKSAITNPLLKYGCNHHDLDQLQLPPGTGLKSAFLWSYWIKSPMNGIQALGARKSCLVSHQPVSHGVKRESREGGGGCTNRIKHFFFKLYFSEV